MVGDGVNVESSSLAAVRSPLRITRCGARSDRRSQTPVGSHVSNHFLVVPSCDVTSAKQTTESDCASVPRQAQIRPCTTRPIITLPRRYACQKSMRREMRSARPFTVNNNGIDARNGQAYHGGKTTTTNGARPAVARSCAGKEYRRCFAPCVRSRAGAPGRT
jgi:hypothetical protein